MYGAYYSELPFEFGFSVDPGNVDRVTIQLTPPPPTGFKADYAGGLTDLSWAASPDPLVTGYSVYSKVGGEPSLKPLGTTTGTTYPTDHQWAADDTVFTRLYAVSAEYTNGAESFLSRLTRNNDRDHDGRTDQEETDRGTSLDDPDTDDDGLTDGEEEFHGTDPFNWDSDGDGYSDADEIAAGSDPRNPNSFPGQVFDDGFETGDTSAWSSATP